jgi:hypothetical protein
VCQGGANLNDMTKQEITALVKERDNLLKTDKKNVSVDGIQKQIIDVFCKRLIDYEVDFILETLTMFGQAPNVIYDDNGLFAVSAAGYQAVVTGREKIEGAMTVFVEKKQWKKTIRLALKHYLSDEG